MVRRSLLSFRFYGATKKLLRICLDGAGRLF
jgi:hypothetical protein